MAYKLVPTTTPEVLTLYLLQQAKSMALRKSLMSILKQFYFLKDGLVEASGASVFK